MDLSRGAHTIRTKEPLPHKDGVVGYGGIRTVQERSVYMEERVSRPHLIDETDDHAVFYQQEDSARHHSANDEKLQKDGHPSLSFRDTLACSITSAPTNPRQLKNRLCPPCPWKRTGTTPSVSRTSRSMRLLAGMTKMMPSTSGHQEVLSESLI